MNYIWKLISFLILGITPSSFAIRDGPDGIITTKASQDDQRPLTPRVLDVEGKPVKANSSYLILPANPIKGLQLANNATEGNGQIGIGLFSLNKTCPFFVVVRAFASPLKFQTDDITGVHEESPINFLFDPPLGAGCPEPKTWRAILGKVSSFRGYVKTGPYSKKLDDPFYAIKRVGLNNGYVYRIQYCILPSDEDNGDDVTCSDIKVQAIRPSVMALVYDYGVGAPLFVKFQKLQE